MPLHMTVAVCKCYTVCVMLRGGVCERNVLTQNTQRIRATSRQDRQRKGWSSQYRENICVWVCTCGEGGGGRKRRQSSWDEHEMHCLPFQPDYCVWIFVCYSQKHNHTSLAGIQNFGILTLKLELQNHILSCPIYRTWPLSYRVHYRPWQGDKVNYILPYLTCTAHVYLTHLPEDLCLRCAFLTEV